MVAALDGAALPASPDEAKALFQLKVEPPPAAAEDGDAAAAGLPAAGAVPPVCSNGDVGGARLIADLHGPADVGFVHHNNSNLKSSACSRALALAPLGWAGAVHDGEPPPSCRPAAGGRTQENRHAAVRGTRRAP